MVLSNLVLFGKAAHYGGEPLAASCRLPPSQGTCSVADRSSSVAFFGIRIGVDVSWFIVLFLIIFSLTELLRGRRPRLERVPAGHGQRAALLPLDPAARARSRGGGHPQRDPDRGIDLWMFGGVAKLGRDTDSPGVEFRVAVAGPLVTLAIAGLCFGARRRSSRAPSEVLESARFTDDVVGASTAVLGYLASINVIVLVFNLIPGFPLDGGRIARAIAWKITGDRNKATRFAGMLGRGFGYLMIAGGAPGPDHGVRASSPASGSSSSASSSRRRPARPVAQARFADRIGDIRVADVMDAEPVAIPVACTLDRSRAASSSCATAGPGSRWWTPAGRLVGVVSREAVASVPESERDPPPRDLGHGSRRRRQRPARPRRGSARESCSASDGLSRLGAVMAVDDGVLRGIVTVERCGGRCAAPWPSDPRRGAATSSSASPDAPARRPRHRSRPRRPARRPRSGGEGRIRGHHLQGPPGALALERRPGRHQRGARPAGLLGVARLRHGQGLRLPGRPGRHRDHVPRGARGAARRSSTWG